MIGYIKILLCSFALVSFLVRTCVQDHTVHKINESTTSIEPKTDYVTIDNEIFEEKSETTRGVLITHCGSCHQSTLDSHKVAAIKIFDLDQGTRWHNTLLEEHLSGITNRTQNKNSISNLQKEAISIFIKFKAIQLKNQPIN